MIANRDTSRPLLWDKIRTLNAKPKGKAKKVRILGGTSRKKSEAKDVLHQHFASANDLSPRNLELQPTSFD